MSMLEKVCISCRAGFHGECSRGWSLTLNEDEVCCCGGSYTLRDHWVQIMDEQNMTGDPDGYPAPKITERLEHNRGKSGYIAQAAWGTSRDIGTLREAGSSGRKRVKEMYPISPGQVCEWAMQKNCGGGVYPILGCMGNPASELHHGPDKNTLNNEKMSRGIGDSENVHPICSECHNAWHGANDPTYPKYDRNAQQTEPWLPEGAWTLPMPGPATVAELIETVRSRAEEAERRGRTRGRNTEARGVGDFTVKDDEED